MLDASRELVGVIEDSYQYTYKDGVAEETLVADVAGQKFDVPSECLIGAGYEEPKVGDTFRVVWPHGRIPRSMGRILPPVETIAGEL